MLPAGKFDGHDTCGLAPGGESCTTLHRADSAGVESIALSYITARRGLAPPLFGVPCRALARREEGPLTVAAIYAASEPSIALGYIAARPGQGAV
jgi:hypothetical protein